MLKTITTTTAATALISPSPLLFSKSPSKFPFPKLPFPKSSNSFSTLKPITMSWLNKLGFGTPRSSTFDPSSTAIAQGPDDDVPNPGQQFAEFGAGCFWGVELAYQRVSGVTKTEVGYSQGFMDKPSYEDVCSGVTNHNEVVRVQYDPNECGYDTLLDVFWSRHDPTTPNRSGNDVGTQYRSGIYFYTPEQEKAAIESKERQEKIINKKIVTEIVPAKKFYRAENYHQQYLAKGDDLVSDNLRRKVVRILSDATDKSFYVITRE